MNRRTRHAFTLIELMVVIGIIALLIGFSVPAINKVRRAAQGAATSSQLSAIASAIQQYYGDFKSYPGPLRNDQIGAGYFPGANYSGGHYVYVIDPSTNTPYDLKLTMGTPTAPAPGNTFVQIQQITGAENLVLGLLGGLELNLGPLNNGSYPIQYFSFNPYNIFPDGVTPSPKGATSLNPVSPKRYASYLQVRSGDLSTPNVQFSDSASRLAEDSVIPEFLDKFSEPLPILYLRANVGALGVVSQFGKDENGVAVTYQYDLAQCYGYTRSQIGTIAKDIAKSHHGLRKIVPAANSPITDSIMADFNAGNHGYNALVYLKDPNTPPTQPNNQPMTNALASPRQKDGFILISAGPDGLYGTSDDVIYPGTLNP